MLCWFWCKCLSPCRCYGFYLPLCLCFGVLWVVVSSSWHEERMSSVEILRSGDLMSVR